MRTPMQIFKKHNIHYYENDENAIEIAMQEYADESACAFAEFMAENYVPILQHQKLQYWQKNYQDKSKKYTTTELLEIYKQQINGKV